MTTKLKWKDETSYSANDKNKIPRVLKCIIESCEIVVHRIHGLDGWYLKCKYLNIEEYHLQCDKLEDCKGLALDIVKQELFAKAKEIQQIKKILKQLEDI